MTADRQQDKKMNPGLLIVAGLLTLALVFLAYAAMDDITTDNATSFTTEYGVLIACGFWGGSHLLSGSCSIESD